MKISCNVICDLLPSYIDDICSDDTRKLVEEHISVCDGCRSMLLTMKDTQVDMTGNETLQIDHMKKIRSRHNMVSLGSYLLLFMMLLPILYFIYQNVEQFSNQLFVIVLLVLILASFLTAGSKSGFTRIKGCLCGIAGLLIICEYVLMRMSFTWIMKESLPFGMEAQNLGPFIRNLLLIMTAGELMILIYSIVNGRLKDTDNTYSAAVSVTGVVLALADMNLLRQLEDLNTLTVTVNQTAVVLVAELVILLACYYVFVRFRKSKKYKKFRNG